MGKSVLLASISVAALSAGFAGAARADCSFGTPSTTGISVGCRDEFQQVLRYNPQTRRLTLSDPGGGRPTVRSDVTFDGKDAINLRGNDTAGDDVLEVATGGKRSLDLGADDDRVSIDDASLDGTILGGAGNDFFRVRSTDVAIGGLAFDGGTGNDTVHVSGGTVGGFVGGSGDDSLRFDGGEITGDVKGFESVTLVGDAIVNTSLKITGGDNTSVTVLDLRPPVNGTGAADAFGLDLAGVRSLRIANSTASLLGTDGIDDLVMRRAVLRISGDTNLAANRHGGRIDLTSSTIDATNGDPTDVLRVSSARLTNTTFSIDAATNANGNGIADQLIIRTPQGTNPRLTNVVRGNNTLVVNFVDGFSGPITGIPVAQVFGVKRNDILDALATFKVVGGTNVNPLQALTVQRDNDGNLVLKTDVREAPVATSVATTNIADFSSDSVDDIATDLASGTGDRVAVSDQFGVFASGQFGHTWHYGYDVSDGTTDSRTPDFEVDNFSAFITGEADLGEIGSSEIGFRVAGFGGYVQSDVTFDQDVGAGLPPTAFEGSGFNRGGLFGASVSFDRLFGEGNYAYNGTTVAGFFGNTDVSSADTGADGNYDTAGVVITDKFGVAFALADKLRLDTRFGIGYTYFEGDSFTDESGTRFGKSRTSYATLSFEPGLQTAVAVGSVVVTPQARLLLDYKAGYVNDASQDNVDFNFDESHFSVGGELGAGVLITKNLTAGAFISAKASDDQTSLLGRLAVKYQF